MSAKPDIWMPLYLGAYIADTLRFTTEQHGAYLLIIMDYWRNGPPPDDNGVLAQITKLSVSRWKAHRPVIAPKFQIANGVWKHKRIEHELNRAREMQTILSDRGKAGAAARWGKDSASNATCNATTDAQALREDMPADAPRPLPRPLQTPRPRPSPEPSPEPKSAPHKRGKSNKTRLPDDFSVSDRVAKWAAEKGFSRLPEHLEYFIGKARAHGYTYVDWDEALMSAVRDDWAKLRNGKSDNRESTIAEAERRIFGAEAERDITDESKRL